MRTRLVYAGCIAIWLVLSALVALSIASHALLSAEQQFNRDALQLSEQLNQKLQNNETVLTATPPSAPWTAARTCQRKNASPGNYCAATRKSCGWAISNASRPSNCRSSNSGCASSTATRCRCPPPAAMHGNVVLASSRSFIEPVQPSTLLAADLGRLQSVRRALQDALESDAWKSPARSSCPACRPAIC